MLITDNNNHPLVKSWIACAASENVNTSRLNDDPYQYDRLVNLDRLYNVIVSRDGLPYYGHFIIKYPNLPSDVARIFARAYKTKLFSDTIPRRFWFSEQKIYENILAQILIDSGIGTLFFTRHSDSVGNEQKWIQFHERFGYPLEHRHGVVFRQHAQNVHYFNVWNSPLDINRNFIERLPNA